MLEPLSINHVDLRGIDLDQLLARHKRMLCVNAHRLARLHIEMTDTRLIGFVDEPHRTARHVHHAVHHRFEHPAHHTQPAHGGIDRLPGVAHIGHLAVAPFSLERPLGSLHLELAGTAQVQVAGRIDAAHGRIGLLDDSDQVDAPEVRSRQQHRVAHLRLEQATRGAPARPGDARIVLDAELPIGQHSRQAPHQMDRGRFIWNCTQRNDIHDGSPFRCG